MPILKKLPPDLLSIRSHNKHARQFGQTSRIGGNCELNKKDKDAIVVFNEQILLTFNLFN